MGFKVIDPGVDEDHCCIDDGEWPWVYDTNQGAVLECTSCGQRWVHSRFHVWERTHWKREDER